MPNVWSSSGMKVHFCWSTFWPMLLLFNSLFVTTDPNTESNIKFRLVKLVRQSPHRTLIQSIKELFYVERLECSPSADRIRQWQRIRRNCKQICGKQNSVEHDLRVFFIGSVARVWTNHDGTRCWLPQWMRFYFFLLFTIIFGGIEEVRWQYRLNYA